MSENNLHNFYGQMAAHSETMQDQIHHPETGTVMDIIADDVYQMTQAVDYYFPGQVTASGQVLRVIAGEQSVVVMPKQVAKQVAMVALQNEYGVTPIDLRADLDLVGSEADIVAVPLPNTGDRSGRTTYNLLSGKYRASNGATNGVALPNPYVTKMLTDLQNKHLPQIYTRSLQSSRGGYEPTLDQQVVADWMACYGIAPDGSRLKQMPDYMTASNNYSTTVPEIGIELPTNFAQGNENHRLWMQRQLGIEAQYVVSEGEIDRILLQNGGFNALRVLLTSARQWLREDGYQPNSAALKLEDDKDDEVPFNIVSRGRRAHSANFLPGDDSMIHVQFDPEGKYQADYSVDQLLNDPQFGISLKAIPRVILYSLAGLSGHITGGGSIYNYDAQQIMDIVGLPYFPLWNFTKKDQNGKRVTALSYVSTGIRKLRSSDEIKAEGNEETVLAYELSTRGRFAFLDLMMSTYADQAAHEIGQLIAMGGNITPDTYVELTNRTGRVPSDYRFV